MLKRAIRHLADGPRPAEDAVIVVVPDSAAADRGRALLEAMVASPFRVSVVAAAGDETVRANLAGIADLDTRQPRLPAGIPARAVLSGLRTRAMVVIAGAEGLPPVLRRMVAGGVERDLPIFGIDPGTGAGVAVRPLSPIAEGTLPPPDAGIEALAHHFARAVGIERGQGGLLEPASRRLQALIEHPLGRRILAPFIARLDTLDALSQRLGRPGTILCLGNGPTSADPSLAAMPRDALFRVNHQWMRQGYLTEADLLFAGVKRSMRAAGRIPLLVSNARKERSLLAARIFEFWNGPATYAVAEQVVPGGLPPVAGPLRPTTGAYMIAVAVALAPRRLVVAGMDMFSHPEGAYPGGIKAENAYAPSHDFETDAAFIRAALARFEGELVTLSPAFEALAREVEDRAFSILPARAASGSPVG